MKMDLQVIKETYSNMDWEGFRDDAGDLLQVEIDIYDAVVVEGVPALIAEVERLRKENKDLTQMVLHDTHDEFVAVREIKTLREALETTKSDILSIGDVISVAVGHGETIDLGNLNDKLHEMYTRLDGEK